ncbi:hypothetical protein HN992_00670 [Candidatus Woesearchaeota archaeon]|jgi:hypothetical protein|nr:hypothetical protein [Candidatus Woesearchaeota archaeon]MBT3438352.1 hypothetical protein [Candidatus Woesearchaeota archaeon]MBT4058009.1 hypothetical protein [Candidatus Woesearchaeota archaeon]MBT4207639.1 hypothetical protein [Candidatus Woesearchaeota archaeon]MBT4730598.1 hypothetical protein [Candidatus Woesearchaeota archaeon]
MPTKQKKERMTEYLANSLTAAGHSVKDFEIAIDNGNLPIRYLILDDEKEKSVFLIDDSKNYNERNTEQLVDTIRRSGIKKPGFVIYKDGKQFFRCPESSDNDLMALNKLLRPNRSLKNYMDRAPGEFILPTKAEKRLKKSGFLQYYQPESERLDEMLVTFGFDIPLLDYTHINPRDRIGPRTKLSEKYFLIENRFNMPGALELDIEKDGFLRNPKN